jgi:ribosomal protein L33
MAKGKRTYVAFYSKQSGNMIHMTNIAKKNFAAGEKLTLKKYNKVTRKHEEVTMKEIKKG